MKKDNHRKVTLQDIADIVGVSKGTVDRAIHNRSDINEETKQKVLEVAKELNYTPNRAARSLALKERKKIGVIIRNKPIFYWDRMEEGILSAYRELQDYGIDVVLRRESGLYNPKEQVILIEELVEEDLDALIIVPVSSPLTKVKLNEVTKKGITLVTLNDDIEVGDRIFYIGPHLKQSGNVGAKLMGQYLQGEGNIITIDGILKSLSYQQRLEGFKEELNRQYPDIRIAANCYYDHDKSREYNAKKIQEVIKSVPDLKGIYNVDGASLYETGCIVREVTNRQDITFIGHEIWDKVEGLMREDIIDVVINQDAYVQGYYAVKILYQYLLEGEEPEFKEYYTRMDIMVKESLSTGNNVIN